MKRICIYCQTWKTGGIEAFITNNLKHMDLSDMEVDVVAEVLGESVFTDDLGRLGVRFQELSGDTRRFVRNCRMLSALMDERDYDVFHLNAFQALSMATISLARRKGIPVRIAHSHNTMLRKSSTRALKMLIHDISRELLTGDATELWAASRLAAEFMYPRRLLEQKGFTFIPNGIDVQRFRFDRQVRDEVRARLGLEDAYVIGNVARLCYQKNQSFLLDVFKVVYDRHPKARLLLVGEGEDEARLKEQAASLGLMDAVIFYGTSGEVERLMWAMDVFAFPSVFEGLGIVAIEAQAAGLPTICSTAIPPEVAVSRAVSFIPTDDKQKWTVALTDGIVTDGMAEADSSGKTMATGTKPTETKPTEIAPARSDRMEMNSLMARSEFNIERSVGIIREGYMR